MFCLKEKKNHKTVKQKSGIDERLEVELQNVKSSLRLREENPDDLSVSH